MTTLLISALIDDIAAATDAARIAAAHSERWLNAINAGYDWLVQQDVIEYDMKIGRLTMPSAETPNLVYNVGARCQCIAARQHKPCRHVAAAQLVRRALGRQASEARRVRAYREVMELFV